MLPKKQSLFSIGVLICLIGMGLSCEKKLTAEQLINLSLEAHGGKDAWEAIEKISYSKQTILYDSLGTVESNQTKVHAYNFKPTFAATMTWREDSMGYSVSYSEEKTSLFINDSLVVDTALLEKFENEVRAAYYVYWMPYKLMDENAELKYEGMQKWPSEGKVHKLEVSYPDSWNIWSYYFDPETYKLVGTEVYHEPTTSFIKNTKYETGTGLFLNAERQSYHIDEAGDILYKRADYFYTVLKINRN